MPKSLLRPAVEHDLAGMSALWYEHAALLAQQDSRWVLLPNARSAWESAVRSWLADADVCSLVVEEADGLNGYIVGALQASPPGFSPLMIGVVRSLAVDAHHHSAGTARLLFGGARDWFRQRGVTQIVVDVPKRAAIEQAFWRAQNGVPWMERLWIPS
jgi:GNAT superfamily N-acetyltransferase